MVQNKNDNLKRTKENVKKTIDTQILQCKKVKTKHYFSVTILEKN